MTKQHFLFSAPGRTEISGNHTDHQCGCVLAAAVNLETVALVVLNDSSSIRVRSEGYPETVVGLDDLNLREGEKNTTAALIRVHGGGFAGTVQAFVPVDMLEEFKYGVERVLGSGSCHVLQIRNEGGVRLR